MCTPTCGTGGFQRMFLSGAGVKPVVPVGLFLRSRSTPLGSSRSLTTRFFSCHPTWCTGTHANKAFSVSGFKDIQVVAVCVVLTTVCWLTWMTSSPAWIFLVRSAGDWREKPTKKLVTRAQSSSKHKHGLHISASVQLFFALRKCQTRLTRRCRR